MSIEILVTIFPILGLEDRDLVLTVLAPGHCFFFTFRVSKDCSK